MKQFFTIVSILAIVTLNLSKGIAQTATEDTITVQAFTYQSPQDAWFNFPSDTNKYRKILMLYNLHCPDPTQCGEWDYLTYTYLYEHTGVLDSTLNNHSSFTVSDASPDSIHFNNSPTYSYQTSEQYSLIVDSVISSQSVSIGSGSSSSFHPFHTMMDSRARTVYLWKASELSPSLVAGNITSLTLNATFAWGTELNHLKIRMAPTSIDSLEDAQLNATWTQVYNHNTYLTTGANSLLFTNPFAWDGISNVMVEISFDNNETGWDNLIAVTPESWSAGITSSGNDRDIFLTGNEFVQVPQSAFSSLDSFVTISYWAFGNPATQPNNGTCFEGIDSTGHRVLNSHCPWSDSNVYWDAGSDGTNYDRISHSATTPQTEGQWNYWTFTKNCATGIMNIYLNGHLFHTGSGLTKLMNGIKYFRIGRGNWGGSESFHGAMDEFAMWNVELDSTTIQQYMFKDIDASHPFYNNMICYYQFNDHNDTSFADSSLANDEASIMGSLQNNFLPSQTLFRNYLKLYERPNIVFEEAVFNSHIDTTIEIDTIENLSFSVVLYSDSLNPTVATDTIWVWQPVNYFYDANGNPTDTIFLSADSSIYKQIWYWYGVPFEVVNRYELSRFITLYGNGTTLGNSGRTWVYDLTDLAPLLHDSVHLSSGNWQEWLNMKFLLIKGTPARNPISVTNLWNGDYWHDSNLENGLHPMVVKIDTLAKNTMWRSLTTGHGQAGPNACDEFCQNFQYGKVNGAQHFSQLIWRDDCAKNPLFPQGGTWVYQRANWCPGSEVREYDWELTPYVTPGDSEILDLDFSPPGSYNGNYVISTQLISFSLPNFSLDAEVYDIKRPTDQNMWSRENPICDDALITIRNGGTTPLTSALITYGVEGGPVLTYNWTGNLGFLQKADITLPTQNWMWSGDSTHRFYATISSPNGGADENTANNKVTTHYNLPPMYNVGAIHKIVLEVKTNVNGWETSYTLVDGSGNTLISRNGLSANTYYRDTVSVDDGMCYTFHINDSGEDGLSFWANPGQGSGIIRLRKADALSTFKVFGTDFGAELTYQFTVGWTLDAPTIPSNNPEIHILPNPSSDFISVMFETNEKATYSVIDLSGKILMTKSSDEPETIFDIHELASGLYFIKVKSGNKEYTEKFLKVD